MNHNDALKLNAAEKYLLGELSVDERAEYEEHYFTCPECAEDVKAGVVMLDNARAVLRTEFQRNSVVAEPSVGPRWWFGWFRPAYALAAVVTLIAAVSYQNFVTIPRLRRDATPQTLASYSLVTLQSRSNAAVTIASDPSRPFGLYLDIPATRNFASYTCRVVSDKDAQVFAVQISAAQARDTVQLLVPASTLKSGNYALVVSGNRSEQGPQTGDEIARYPFAFQATK